MKKEKEEERKRIEEEERAQREEMERRRADYERAKEQDRHRLEREQQQRRKEEEDKERRREMKRKEEQNNITSVIDDWRRQEVDAHRKNKEKERTEVERSSQVENEFKREEEREENEIKGNEVIVRKIEDNNERIRHGKNMENTLDDDRNPMKKQDKTKGIRTEDTERLDDMRPQTKSDKDGIKSHEEKKRVDGNIELDSQINLSQSRKSFKLTKTTPESHINAHQGLSNDLGISLIGSSSVADHLSVEVTPSVDTDLTMPASDLNDVAPKMNTRGHQNTTAIEHEPESQESVSVCLPDSTEQKRLAWMMSCTPWSKLSLQNKRKVSSAQQQSQKRGPRRKRVPSLPPLSVNTILKTGTWSSLKQVEIKTHFLAEICLMFLLTLLSLCW